MPQTQISPQDFDWLHDHFLKHPEEFVTDVLGSKPWSKQIEIIKSVFGYKFTAVKTCNAIGKSYIGARIVVTYLMLHPDSIVVTTAPTWRQVTDVLWREVGTALAQSKFKLTDKEANQAGLTLDTNWYAVGLSTSRPENFFGYHADNILVVVDEAGGVDERIFTGVAAITPNLNARVLLIGNPTNPSGTFYDAFTKPQLGYNCITVSAFDTPNFTDVGIHTIEDLLKVFTPRNGISQADWTNAVNEELTKRSNPTYSGLISPERVYSRYFEWGVDSPGWQALIMGEFPTEADQQLIPTNLVTMAMNMYGKDDETGESYAKISGWNIPDGMPEYGQDMARFGSDSSVNYGRRGGWVNEAVVWNKTDLVTSAYKILNIIDPLDRDVRVNIDDTGNGGGTTDKLREASRDSFQGGMPIHQYQLVAYNFGSKEMMSEPQKAKFHDVTSMLYWNLRSWFVNKQIALHDDEQLKTELVGRRWGFTPQGKIKVESKDDYKKRTGGRSPDRSDALALAFAGGMRQFEAPNTKKGSISARMRPQTADLLDRY